MNKSVQRKSYNRFRPTKNDVKLGSGKIISKKLARLKEALKKERATRKHYEQLFHDLTTSTSWRITKPLRDTKAICKKIWPLWGFKRAACEIEVKQNFLKNGNLFKPSGPSARLEILSKQAFPDRLVEISVDLKEPAEELLLRLYFGNHPTMERISGWTWLHLKPGITQMPVQLPERVTVLQLEPLSHNAEFAIENLTIRKMGWLEKKLKKLMQLIKLQRLTPKRALILGIKGTQLVIKEGPRALLHRLKIVSNSNYAAWIRAYDELSEKDLTAINRRISELPYQPLISIVMPVWNTDATLLREAIDSVINQLYGNWEFCIADDFSAAPHVRPILEEYQQKDSRIKLVFRPEGGHISKASNSALEMATGEFIALLDHDDLLRPHALYLIVEELNKFPEANLIYSDEDKITESGVRLNAYFKPDFNHELMLSQNYICHLACLRASLIKDLGGFQSKFDGSQDWDLFLRVIEKSQPEQIRHIPFVLYHWRLTVGSTAQSTSFKPYVLAAQQATVTEHLARLGYEDVKVSTRKDICHQRVVFPVPKSEPKVSILMPTKDGVHLLKTCIGSIYKKTNYKNFEIILLDNNSSKKSSFEYFEKLQQEHSNLKVVRDTGAFNFSRINNFAATHATGDYFAFLNNDLEVISKDWLTEMLSMAVRPQVGAVGARLYWPNKLLQHGGVVLGIGGVAGHAMKGAEMHNPGYWNTSILTHEVSAVTAACMLMPRKVFQEVQGFDEVNLPVSFNDVDLCLRVREQGYKVIYAPYAKLYHHESASRGLEDSPEKVARAEKEIAYMHKRWGNLLKNDPYYNPNLTVLTEDYQLAFPTRVVRPWKAA